MSGLQRNIQVQSDTLANLVLEVEKGNYRIPQFQRDYVWEISKVRKLFDSIYREYPIGSFFLWKAGRTHNSLFRQSPGLDLGSPREDDDVSFILDGQQRITSIYITLKGLSRLGSDYRHVCFDLKNEKFTFRAPDNRRYISVSDIWGPNALKLSREIDHSLVSSFERCYQTLRTYPVSIVEVRDKGLDAVCRIFQRINQGGKRLDRFDLIAAMTFDPEFDLRERVDEDIIRPITQSGFGKIPRTLVTQLLALKHKGSCTDTAQYALTRDETRSDWKAVIDSIKLAIDFLRTSCHVIRFEFLPYNPFITLVSYYFLLSGNRAVAPEHQEWMIQWFWRSTFGQRYGAGGASRISQDSKLINELLDGRTPEYNVPIAVDIDGLINTKMTFASSAIRNGFLCLLASKRPLHLKSNAELNLPSGNISDFTYPQKHHIFPRSYLRRQGLSGNVHSLPNFCFIPAELNKQLSDTAPSKYFRSLSMTNNELQAALDTHLIPSLEDSGILEDEFMKFLKVRATHVLQAIENRCGVAQRPDPLKRHHAVERAEHQVRDFIDAVLSLAYEGEYWKYAVTSDIQEYVKRVGGSSRGGVKQRVADLSSRDKLNFCDVSHYQKIILNKKNWPHFEPFLLNKLDVERQFAAFREYRNCVMHNRELPQLIRMGGEEALTWLNSVLTSKEEVLGEQQEAIDDDEELTDDDTLGEFEDLPAESAKLVPQKPGDSRAISQGIDSRISWNESTFFAKVKSELADSEVSVLRKLYDWSIQNAEKLNWGRGKVHGSFSPVFEAISRSTVFSVYSNGDISVNSGFTSAESVPSKGLKHRIRHELEEAGFLTSDHCRSLRYPAVTCKELNGRTEQFLNIIERILELP